MVGHDTVKHKSTVNEANIHVLQGLLIPAGVAAALAAKDLSHNFLAGFFLFAVQVWPSLSWRSCTDAGRPPKASKPDGSRQLHMIRGGPQLLGSASLLTEYHLLLPCLALAATFHFFARSGLTLCPFRASAALQAGGPHRHQCKRGAQRGGRPPGRLVRGRLREGRP